ncbi:hypothetical protein MPER_11258 [Moniliophthora perniciosa FA553]|nr:hypothetical protein MPER_11258 [Moniliophthora perniciosa FA553]
MFKDTQFYEPNSTETIVIDDGKLYIPYISNEVGIDAFYVGSVEDENGGKKRVLSLLKMTVAATHKLNKGILTLKKRFQGLPEKWRLIFVQPYETCLKVPYMEDLSHVELFHVRIPPSSLEEKIPPPKESQEVDNGEDEEEGGKGEGGKGEGEEEGGEEDG